MIFLIGAMAMPVDFKYREVFLKGRPRHERFDDFWRKHPPMSTQRWAKIFSPFDALEGFDECIESKLVQYCEKRVLSEEEKATLNDALNRLHELTYNSRVARLNQPQATMIYFIPCSDPHNEWYGIGGRYETTTGTVQRVDALVEHTLILDVLTIPLDTISEIIIGDTHTCG